MANELAFGYGEGFPVSYQFNGANPAANTTTDLTAVGQNSAGFVVPAGYKFHPLMISVSSNADLTAGTLIAKVTSDGTAVGNGPTATLSDTVQRASGVQRRGVAPIAAGAYVGAELVADASYAPVTADIDVHISGLLLPA